MKVPPPVTDNDFIAPTATKNGINFPYPSNGKFTSDGVYVIRATDAAGNAALFHFAIDKTGPGISAVNSDHDAVLDNGIADRGVSVTIAADTVSFAVDKGGADYDYPAGGLFTEEGSYTVTAADALGNEATFHFTIDKTAPTLSAVLTGTTTIVTEGQTIIRGSGVTLSVSETKLIVSITKGGETYREYPLDSGDDEVLLWDIIVSNSLDLSDNGEYAVTITDLAGNTVPLGFTIDLAE